MGYGGGSDSGGTQTINQVREMPAWAQPYQENLLQTGMQAIQQPVQEFQGMRVAPMNQAQQVGLSMMQGRALNPSPDETAARQQALATAQGGYLNTNPYTSVGGFLSGVAGGKMLNSNPWLSNDYTQQAINQNAQAMGQGYATGTAAQLDAAAARSRALGGSGYQQAVGQNEMQLGNAIGNMANQYQLGRTGMGVQDYQSGIQQALGAGQIGSSAFQQERGNMMQAIPYGFQGGQLDYTNAERMLQSGGLQRGYQQQLLDQIYSDYMTQANRPFEQIDRAGALLGMATGNVGATTQTTSSNQGNNWGQLAALPLLGYGFSKMG